MYYINIYQTSGDVQTAINEGTLLKPYIALISGNSGDSLDFNTKEIIYSEIPLTFEILSAGTIVWKASNTAITKTIQYSLDNGTTWTSITSSTAGASFNVNAGDKVQFKGDNTAYAQDNEFNNFNSFEHSTATFNIYGNIMSLINSTNYKNLYSVNRGAFVYMFRYAKIVDASNLVLPATTVGIRSYAYMFYDCNSLVNAPSVLPATTLGELCYYYMFCSCTSLVTAPSILPATTLANYCYSAMFNGCSSLTTAPELPASALTTQCYNQMFYGCTSLTTAPELPATTLVNYCYNEMFRGCSSLNNIKCYAITNITSNTDNWVYGVASSGTFTKAAGVTWPTGNNGIPTNWVVLGDDNYYLVANNSGHLLTYISNNNSYDLLSGFTVSDGSLQLYVAKNDISNKIPLTGSYDYFDKGGPGTECEDAPFNWRVEEIYNDTIVINDNPYFYYEIEAFSVRINSDSATSFSTIIDNVGESCEEPEPDPGCDDPGTCGEDEYWNYDYCMCEPITPPDDPCPMEECGEGEHWDDGMCMCVPDE